MKAKIKRWKLKQITISENKSKQSLKQKLKVKQKLILKNKSKNKVF